MTEEEKSDLLEELKAQAEWEDWLLSDEYQEMEDRKNQHVDPIEREEDNDDND